MTKDGVRIFRRIPGNIAPCIAGFAGVVVGVGASFAIALPLMRSAITSAVNQAGQHALTAAPVSDTLADVCAQQGGGAVLGASTGPMQGTPAQAATAAPAASQGSSASPAQQAPSIVKQAFITKLTGGAMARTTAAITNTGPSSANTITTMVTSKTSSTTTNNVSVTNNNEQTANSGAATVAENTTAGSADSGAAANANSFMAALKLDN